MNEVSTNDHFFMETVQYKFQIIIIRCVAMSLQGKQKCHILSVIGHEQASFLEEIDTTKLI